MTHMEWFQRPDGTPVIGEIAQRPPGANISLMTGLAHDTDIYRTPERPATRQSAGWSRRRGDGYEGDGYVVLRDPSTEVVRDALNSSSRRSRCIPSSSGGREKARRACGSG